MADDLSLRDTIKAAFAADEASEPADLGDAATAAPAAEDAPATPETGADSAPATDAKAAPVRDAGGKFAKTDAAPATDGAAAAAQISEPASTAGEPAPQKTETSRPPHALPAALKAKWAELPPEWQTAMVAREDEVNAFRAQQQGKAERLNRFDEIVTPHRQRLAISGVDDVTWFRNLAAAEQVLIENPVAGIAYLARQYGADLRQVAAQVYGGQPGGQQGFPTMDPNIQAILGEVQTLKQTVTQQQQSAEESKRAAVQSQIEAFANDPAHLYFADVKDDIAALLQAGRATDLKDAYDKAIWANPEIRALLQQQAAAQTARPDPTAQARAKATAAAQAAASVTGAPGPGGSPGGYANPSDLRATIKSAWDQAAGRV